VSAVALLCVARWSVANGPHRVLGVHNEMTFWEGGLTEALEAAARLAWPTCGPRCIGSGHLLVWHSGDRFRVLDLSRLARYRPSREMRVLAELLAAGLYDVTADLANHEISVTDAQKEYRQRRSATHDR
jgi:hypothetical protein